MNRIQKDWTRRRFLQTAASLSALAGTQVNPLAAATTHGVSLVMDPADPVASSAEAKWAASELDKTLTAKGVKVTHCERVAQAGAGDFCIVASGAQAPIATGILGAAKITVPAAKEGLAVASGTTGGKKVLLVSGFDPRGLVYAILDLSDRVANGNDPIVALSKVPALAEHPANEVRSLTRLFTSNVEDIPWYNDREMWPEYLTLLSTQRFNRFNLAFGIGYDFIRKVTDAYFLFTYPFMLKVPGYNVYATNLPDAERDANLAMLKFIGEETVKRGLEFHVGLWMHGYEWINTTNANYYIKGVNKENHGPYCRDAVRMLLQEVPTISGLTFRIHGESGVTEGSFEFWKTVFDGVATCGRTVKIDMHAKGMSDDMIKIALATKQPVSMSPKFWGEHMGMAYHQADIREQERPKEGDEKKTGLMMLSSGTRSFLRYSYGDLIQENRPWAVIHRVWPGTQRVLLWGDPVTAASYSRIFSFCGTNGAEIMESLSFKGRRGSGIAGGRCAYLEPSLKPRWDWQKYEYNLRLWGRLLYNPDAEPDTWQRMLHTQFGGAAPSIESALANSSRILPIITSAYAPSGGNNTYWPELYYNQSVFDTGHPGPYGDSNTPKIFTHASPFDPQIFSLMDEFAAELLGGQKSGKYSPIQVSEWIEGYAAEARRYLKQADATARKKDSPEYRRATIDVAIAAGLGEFFGARFRSGVLFAIYDQTKDRAALEASLMMYRKARSAWAQIIETSKGIYMSDITIGEEPQQRGNWADRLPAIDKDIEDVANKLEAAPTGTSKPEVRAAIQEALGKPHNVIPAITHKAPKKFQTGSPLELALTFAGKPSTIHLYYRHVDQAERFEKVAMEAQGTSYKASIPAEYTKADFPLQYYFDVTMAGPGSSLYPGFADKQANVPYYIVRKA